MQVRSPLARRITTWSLPAPGSKNGSTRRKKRPTPLRSKTAEPGVRCSDGLGRRRDDHTTRRDRDQGRRSATAATSTSARHGSPYRSEARAPPRPGAAYRARRRRRGGAATQRRGVPPQPPDGAASQPARGGLTGCGLAAPGTPALELKLRRHQRPGKSQTDTPGVRYSRGLPRPRCHPSGLPPPHRPAWRRHRGERHNEGYEGCRDGSGAGRLCRADPDRVRAPHAAGAQRRLGARRGLPPTAPGRGNV